MKTPKTNTKIIRDQNHNRLRITPTRLVQIEYNSDRPWYVKAEDIRLAYRLLEDGYSDIRIHEVGTSQTILGTFSTGRTEQLGTLFNRIGCCWFDLPTFNEILRRFGVRKSRARAAKAGR